MLEDLVTAAFNDARDKADRRAGEEMAQLQSGMGLPPGFNLPGMGNAESGERESAMSIFDHNPNAPACRLRRAFPYRGSAPHRAP